MFNITEIYVVLCVTFQLRNYIRRIEQALWEVNCLTLIYRLFKVQL